MGRRIHRGWVVAVVVGAVVAGIGWHLEHEAQREREAATEERLKLDQALLELEQKRTDAILDKVRPKTKGR